MELVRGPYEPNRRSLFLHQKGYVEKICHEYAQEAGIHGGAKSLRRFATPMKLRPDAADDLVMLIVDLADDLFQDILQRHDAHKGAVLIDDDREMLASLAEREKLVQ